MFLCLFLTLGLHQTAYVFLCFCVFLRKTQVVKFVCVFLQQKNCTREPMCFCVFVFFLRKTQKHNDPILLCLFSAIEQHQRTDVFLCFFFNEKHKNTRTKFCLCFFQQYNCTREPLCFCVFLKKSTKTIFFGFFRNRIAAESLSVFTEDSLYCDSKGQSANSMRAE